jgi:hypothetical protein
MSEVQIKCPKCSAELLIDADEYTALQGTIISCLDCNADIVLPDQPKQTSAKFCSSCGASIPPNTKYCTKCGSKVNGISIAKNEEPERIKPRLVVQATQQSNSFASIHSYSQENRKQKAFKTSTLAIICLLLGILGLGTSLLGNYIDICGQIGFGVLIISIICGHIARYQIRKSDGNLCGNGLARAGLILAYTPLLIGFLAGLIMASPSFTKARTQSQANQCMNNIRQIECAKEQWALANKKDTGVTAVTDEVMAYIKIPSAVTNCQAGGTISFGVIGTNATCTIPGHVLSD